MESNTLFFMVDFTMPRELSEPFVQLIPEQRSIVNRLLNQGKILSYALSLEESKLWAVFSVNSPNELRDILESLPLTEYMQYTVAELTFYNASHPFTPAFSMN